MDIKVEQSGAIVIETDLLVLGCDTGLRVSGSLQHGMVPGDDTGLLRATLDGTEFFEPSDVHGRVSNPELTGFFPLPRALLPVPPSRHRFASEQEFGITKALNKCEADLRPIMPSKEAKRVATFKALFLDEAMMLLRETSKLPEGRDEPLTLVLKRLPPEDGDDLKAGMEVDDDYT